MFTLFKAHCKLGHISYQAVRHAILTGLIEGIQMNLNSDEEFCEACAEAKSARQSFPQESKTRASTSWEWVYQDGWGPISVRTLNDKSYTAVWKDDHTRETKVYCQSQKSETFNSYKAEEAWITNYSGITAKFAHFDHGGVPQYQI